MWDLIVSVPDHCLSFYFKFATRTYIKREFDSKMSKTKFTKLAKWARKKKNMTSLCCIWQFPGCDSAG